MTLLLTSKQEKLGFETPFIELNISELTVRLLDTFRETEFSLFNTSQHLQIPSQKQGEIPATLERDKTLLSFKCGGSLDRCVELICTYAKGYETSCVKKEKESLTERSSGPGHEGENKQNLYSILLV